MWIFAILYIVCIIASIIIYFRGCSTFDKYEKNNKELEYISAIKKLKMSAFVLERKYAL